MRTPTRTHDASGLTLVELLLAATIGALVLSALSAGMMLFGTHVENVRAGTDSSADDALALMADMSRHAWLVEQPSDGRLEVVDPHGGVTSFEQVGSSLRLTRPTGLQGDLLEDVEDFTIQTETVQRLRDADPLDVTGVVYQSATVAGTPEAVAVEDGLPVAFGFTLASDSPDEFDVLEDVSEHVSAAAMQTLDLQITYVATLPDDPNVASGTDPTDPTTDPTGGTDGTDGGKGGKKCGKKDGCEDDGCETVVICHVPDGDPSAAHSLEVTADQVDLHLAHGDTLGPCGFEPPVPFEALLTIELFEARAPDDARPFGASLGTVSIPASALPASTATYVLADPEGSKAIICHVPPGNPSKAHTIQVGQSSVPAHLAHGDYLGYCGDHGGGGTYVLEFESPAEPFTIDVTPFSAFLKPGRAYTLKVDVQGPGTAIVSGVPTGTTKNSGFAQAITLDGPMVPQPYAISYSIVANQSITQTEAHDVVTRVTLGLDMEDGSQASGSASVTGQTTVADPWLGVVPNQVEALDDQ